MHFRHILFTGLMVGAALFLPDNALADKNDNSEVRLVHKEAQKADMEIRNAIVQSKGKPVAVEEKITEAVEAKKVVKPKNSPAQDNRVVTDQTRLGQKVTPQIASEKSAAERKDLPDQAKRKTQAVQTKPNKTAKPPKVEKPIGKKGAEPSKQVDNIAQPSQSQRQSELQGEIFSSKIVHSSEDPIFKQEENEKVPVKKKEIPKANQGTSQHQRVQHSSGSATDRLSYGTSHISMLDKWFIPFIYYDIEVIQPCVTSQTWLCNQWVNAPPSPPPQESSDFK